MITDILLVLAGVASIVFNRTLAQRVNPKEGSAFWEKNWYVRSIVIFVGLAFIAGGILRFTGLAKVR